MERGTRVCLYFTFWILLALLAVVLNVLNVDWSSTNIVQGVLIVAVLGVLQGSVLEFPVMTVATLLIGGESRADSKAPAEHLTVVLNYNLLAVSRDDVDECLQTMFEAYMGNLSINVSAVLVSATNDAALKQYELEVRDRYRGQVYDQLFGEGLSYAAGDLQAIDPLHLEHLWSRFAGVDRQAFVEEYLDSICDQFAREFMVIHRVSRVLRKCGQYQDLMLLSEGEDRAYSYTDPQYYGRDARPEGQPLFHAGEDVDNLFGRRFHYTLVLDGDTGVIPGSVFTMMQVAAANPDRGIIQPAIKLHCQDSDTMFMHLEAMRQMIYEPMTNALTALLGQSSYFGKALLQNSVYVDAVIGRRGSPIERVPVDVLSHDTFEAALLRPLYASSTFLLEAPSYNYVTWNIRERRWNRGEVLLAMYFWKNGVGRPMRWLQSKLQGAKFNRTQLRTESKLDFVTSYIAHSALRQMFMKPLLLLYVLLHYNTHLRYQWAPIMIVMFLVLIFPKFATCTRHNFRYVFLETLASFLQFTPEAMVGCVRIVRAFHANISVNVKWVPQRAVEEDFKKSNPFLSSFRQLWGYSAFALVAGVLVCVFAPVANLILVMLITLFLLPLYTGFTSLSKDLRSSRSLAAAEEERRRQEEEEEGAGGPISIIAGPHLLPGQSPEAPKMALAYDNFAFATAPYENDSQGYTPLGYPRLPRLQTYEDVDSQIQIAVVAPS